MSWAWRNETDFSYPERGGAQTRYQNCVVLMSRLPLNGGLIQGPFPAQDLSACVVWTGDF